MLREGSASVISLEDVTFSYRPQDPPALDRVSLRLTAGERVGLIGPTGAGKSTLVQHLNGLLIPSRGRVLWDGRDTRDKNVARRLRSRVGVAFQYPEHQFFEETVLRDVAFAPRQRGLSPSEAEDRAAEALRSLGVSPELWSRSPFELSGGEARRVALAGILAMDPEILVLDEPTAGLDRAGRNLVRSALEGLLAGGRGLVLISHRLEDVAELTGRVWFLAAGRLLADGPTREVLGQVESLRAEGLEAPAVTRLGRELAERGLAVEGVWLNLREAAREILASCRA